MNDRVEEQEWTPEAIEAVRQQARETIERNAITQTQAARECDIVMGTFSSWLGGTYAGRNDRIATKVSHWLRSLEERARIRFVMPTAPRFLHTPTAERLIDVLHHAHHMPDFAVVTGPPGIGKSSACCHYTANNPNVFKLVAEPIHTTLRAFLDDLGMAMGLQPSGTCDRRSRQLILRLTGRGALIIVDEAQHLPSLILDQLRTLHDKSGCGVALVGNSNIFSRLGGTGEAQYAQLHSRVGMRLPLKGASKKDVDALLDAWKVEDSKARALLLVIARKPGALRGLTKTLRIAHMLAGGGAVSADDIRTGYARLNDQGLTEEVAA